MSNALLLWFGAVLDNRVTDLQYHLAKYAKTTNSCSDTALMMAARLNRLEAAAVLLDAEAGIRNADGRTALMIAAMCGHVDMVRLLAEREARVQDEYGISALMYAVLFGRSSVVEILADHETGLVITKAFMLGCLTESYLETEAPELDTPSDSSSAPSTQTPSYASLEAGKRVTVVRRQKLAVPDRGIAPYFSFPAGCTSLAFAILCGDLDMVRILCFEATLCIRDFRQDIDVTPLGLAVETRQPEIVGDLLENGSDLVTDSAHCALYIAILGRHEESLRLLYKREKHLLTDPRIDMPPVALALLEAFLKLRCSPEEGTAFTYFSSDLLTPDNIATKDKHGMSLFLLAAALNMDEVAKAIMDAFPHAISDADNRGQTALHYGAAANSVDVIRRLQRKLLGSVDMQGRTALMVAAWHANEGAIQSLRNESTLIDKQGRSALMTLILGCAHQPRHKLQQAALGLARYLIGDEAGIINRSFRSALMLAVWHRFYGLALQLIDYEKGHQDKSGYTALILAILVNCDDTALLERLCQAEAALTLTDEFGGGKSALMLAIEHEADQTILTSLISTPFATGITDSAGKTALMHAIEKSNIDLAIQLARTPAEVGHRCLAKKQTALMRAILLKQDDVAIVLTSHASELCKQDYKGRTALMHAISTKNVALALILAESERGYRDVQGKSALICALEKRPAFIYQLNLWSEVLLADGEGVTPLHYVRKCRSEQVRIKNKHTKVSTTHDLYTDLLVHGMTAPLVAPEEVHGRFQRYMLQAYERIMLFVQQLLARRQGDRRASIDGSHTDPVFSPGLSRDILGQNSPIARAWSGVILQVTETIYDVFSYDWELGVFHLSISSVLDDFLQAVRAAEDIYTLRDDDLYEDFCCICMDAPVKIVLTPCRHAVLCERCHMDIKGMCPICRSTVEGTIELN